MGFAMCNEKETKGYPVDLDPHAQGQQNCLRKQFEGVDEHMSALEVFYDDSQNRIQLVSSAMPHTFLESGVECDTDKFKFTIMDEAGNTITARRLTLKGVLANATATQPFHV